MYCLKYDTDKKPCFPGAEYGFGMSLSGDVHSEVQAVHMASDAVLLLRSRNGCRSQVPDVLALPPGVETGTDRWIHLAQGCPEQRRDSHQICLAPNAGLFPTLPLLATVFFFQTVHL